MNPLEEILDWSAFSVTVPEADIPSLDTILHAVPPERVRGPSRQCPLSHSLPSARPAAPLRRDAELSGACLKPPFLPQVAAMQRELACVWPFFLYSQVFGAYAGEPSGTDAFSGLVRVLWQRLQRGRRAPLPPCELVRQLREKGCLGKDLIPFGGCALI